MSFESILGKKEAFLGKRFRKAQLPSASAMVQKSHKEAEKKNKQKREFQLNTKMNKMVIGITGIIHVPHRMVFLLFPASQMDLLSHMTWVAVLSLTRSFRPLLVPAYLIAKQSGDAGFGGVAYGREVVTPLQGEHQPPACQTHQLPGQVAEAWTGRK